MYNSCQFITHSLLILGFMAILSFRYAWSQICCSKQSLEAKPLCLFLLSPGMAVLVIFTELILSNQQRDFDIVKDFLVLTFNP